MIEDGKIADVFRILEEPDFKPEKPLAIGDGLTKGLKAAIDSGDFEPVKPD